MGRFRRQQGQQQKQGVSLHAQRDAQQALCWRHLPGAEALAEGTQLPHAAAHVVVWGERLCLWPAIEVLGQSSLLHWRSMSSRQEVFPCICCGGGCTFASAVVVALLVGCSLQGDMVLCVGRGVLHCEGRLACGLQAQQHAVFGVWFCGGRCCPVHGVIKWILGVVLLALLRELWYCGGSAGRSSPCSRMWLRLVPLLSWKQLGSQQGRYLLLHLVGGVLPPGTQHSPHTLHTSHPVSLFGVRCAVSPKQCWRAAWLQSQLRTGSIAGGLYSLLGYPPLGGMVAWTVCRAVC
jgi:hypothetical protein